jgi:hypothetical protein
MSRPALAGIVGARRECTAQPVSFLLGLGLAALLSRKADPKKQLYADQLASPASFMRPGSAEQTRMPTADDTAGRIRCPLDHGVCSGT